MHAWQYRTGYAGICLISGIIDVLRCRYENSVSIREGNLQWPLDGNTTWRC